MKFLFLLLCLVGCSPSIPQKKDYFGVYNIIKIRENGKILNIATLSQIKLTEESYISSIDKNQDNLFSQDEITKSSYHFYVEDDKPFLEINDMIVELLPDHYFDLLLKRTDQLGNETIIYLKK